MTRKEFDLTNIKLCVKLQITAKKIIINHNINNKQEVKMFQEERQLKILEKLKLEDRLSVKEIQKEFNFSLSTIRRDLKILQNNSLLIRTYGGAISLIKGKRVKPFDIRKKEFRESKVKIAKKAASLIERGEFIAIDGSTTTYYMVPFLKNMHDIIILTDSIEIFRELSINNSIELYLTGGSLSRETMNLKGPIAVDSLKRFSFNKLFLGVRGIHLDKGLTGFNYQESITKKNLIDRAKQVIVCADSSKINCIDRYFIGQVEDMDILITDKGIKKEEKESIEQRGIRIILV